MTKNDLINYMRSKGILKTPTIIEAFMRVDRKDFIEQRYHHIAYQDEPIKIGIEQTNSQPSVVAKMLELLQPQKGETVLDVGVGSGWTSGLLSYLVGAEGRVVGTELHQTLIEKALNNLRGKVHNNIIVFKAIKGFGYPQLGPYDKILVSARARELPQGLIEQLKPNGIMVIPIDSTLYKITKTTDEKIEEEKFPGYIFVPLVDTDNEEKVTL